MDRLVFPDGSDFARSSSEFFEHRADEDRATRIYVKVAGGVDRVDQHAVLFAVDTAAEYSFIADRALAQSWDVYWEESYSSAPPGKRLDYLIRRHSVPCDIGTVDLRLLAETGPDLLVSIRIAYPTADAVALPDSSFAVLGYRSGLDRIRFAVSPPDSRWYFDHAA